MTFSQLDGWARRGMAFRGWSPTVYYRPTRALQALLTSKSRRHSLTDSCCRFQLFIYSGYFYSASSSPLLFRGAPNSARILYRSFTPKRHRQLWVKDLYKVSTWRLKRDSNPRPFGRKTSNIPMGHHAPQTRPTNTLTRKHFEICRCI